MFEPRRKKNDLNTSSILARLGINLPVAEDLRNIPLEDVLRFATHRTAERTAFRGAIESILETARSAEDFHELTDYLETNRKLIATTMKDYRATLSEVLVSAFRGLYGSPFRQV